MPLALLDFFGLEPSEWLAVVGGVLEILGFARWPMSVRSDGVDPRGAAWFDWRPPFRTLLLAITDRYWK